MDSDRRDIVLRSQILRVIVVVVVNENEHKNVNVNVNVALVVAEAIATRGSREIL